MKKYYLFHVRQYDTKLKRYRLRIYKIKTEDPYSVIGQMYQTAKERIDNIVSEDFSKEKESHLLDKGYPTRILKEIKEGWDK